MINLELLQWRQRLNLSLRGLDITKIKALITIIEMTDVEQLAKKLKSNEVVK